MHLMRTLTFAAVAQAIAISPAPIEKRFPQNSTVLARGNPPVCVTTPVNNPPITAHCGATGSLTTRSLLFKTTISGPSPLNTCRDQCLADSACISFAWNAADQRCRGFASSLDQQGFKPGPSNGNLFFSRGCFKTKCSPASCVAARLTSPIPVTDYSGGTSNVGYTGVQTFQIPLPFSIGYGIFAKSSALMGLNGFLHSGEISTPFISWAPFYEPVPGANGLEIQQGRDEGLFYEIDGQAPNRIVKFEWRTTSVHDTAERYDVVLQLYEADPTSATYSFLQVTDAGQQAFCYIKNSLFGTVFYSQANPTKLHTGLTLDVQSDTQTFSVNPLPICS